MRYPYAIFKLRVQHHHPATSELQVNLIVLKPEIDADLFNPVNNNNCS